MKVYCDGSLTQACVIMEGGKPYIFDCSPLPKTHNEGEYLAVLAALALIGFREIKRGEILTDSQLVVRQVSGEYKCNYPHLLSLRNQVRMLLKQQGATLSWIPREENLAGKEL